MNDTASFIWAIAIIMLATLGAINIIDMAKAKPKDVQCSVLFKDFNGNKHEIVGTGTVW